jgi:20S proteasome alpha/beta subunit
VSEGSIQKTAPTVTAILGFAAQDRIILASDSQTTTASGAKIASPKIYRIYFQGVSALVAIAGVVDSAELFLENLTRIASGCSIATPRTIADAAESAMKEAREGLLEGFRHSASTSHDLLSRLDAYSCQIILGYYHDRQPYIYVVSLKGAKAIKSTRPFVVVGTGAIMAGAVLDGFPLRTMKSHDAIGAAVYAIESAKRADLHCSGNCQVGYISMADNLCNLLDDKSVKCLQSAFGRVHEEMRGDLAKKIADSIRSEVLDFIEIDFDE